MRSDSPLLAGSGLIEVVPGLMIWTLIVLRDHVLRAQALRVRPHPDRRSTSGATASARRSTPPTRRGRRRSSSSRSSARRWRRHASRPRRCSPTPGGVAEDQQRRLREELDAERQRRIEETRKDVEAETARAIGQIRSEVASLALEATEKVAGKVLTEADQRRLIEEAIDELDFSALEKETV